MTKNIVKIEGAFPLDSRKIVNDNFSDLSLCTTEFVAVTGTTGTTLTNVVGAVTGILQPGTYRFRLNLSTTATANTGITIALKWGTASMITSAQYTARALTASSVVVTKGTTATDATPLLDSAAGVVIQADITGVLVVALAGTLQLQAAQHTAHADETKVLVNSSMEFTPIGATTPLAN